MTERERLQNLISEAFSEYSKTNKAQFKKTFIADYLLANGVIVPPCKVGDTVWGVINSEIFDIEIESVHCFSSNIWKYRGWHGKDRFRKGYEFPYEAIGNDVFLTREEAEQALKEEQNHD